MGEGGGEAAEGFVEEGGGAGDVDAHVAVGAVHCAGVEPEVGSVEEFMFEGVGAFVEGSDVDPYEVGGFEECDGALWEVSGEEGCEGVVVLPDDVADLGEPFFALEGVGCFEGFDAEGVDVADFVDVDGAVDEGACFGCWADDVGYL